MSLMYDKINFGLRISELREKRWKQYKDNMDKSPNPYSKYSCCKSQALLGEKLNIERRTVGKWEQGTATPSLEQALALCDILDCNIDYLLGAHDTTGFSPLSIASLYSNIDISIIEYAQQNPDYLDFINFFMLPKNCSELIKMVSNSGWNGLDCDSSLTELTDPLKSLILDIFHSYQAFTPITQYSIETYHEYVLSKIPEDCLSFSRKKLDDKINIENCLSAQKYKELSLSSNNSDSYKVFMEYLIEYSYSNLTTSVLLEIQKENLSKYFIRLFEEYLSE